MLDDQFKAYPAEHDLRATPSLDRYATSRPTFAL